MPTCVRAYACLLYTSGKAVETAFHATFATIGAIAAASSFIFALVDKDKGITRKRRKAA